MELLVLPRVYYHMIDRKPPQIGRESRQIAGSEVIDHYGAVKLGRLGRCSNERGERSGSLDYDTVSSVVDCEVHTDRTAVHRLHISHDDRIGRSNSYCRDRLHSVTEDERSPHLDAIHAPTEGCRQFDRSSEVDYVESD